MDSHLKLLGKIDDIKPREFGVRHIFGFIEFCKKNLTYFTMDLKQR